MEDPAILKVIELHDDAYNAWISGARKHPWDKAEARGRHLIEVLGPALDLYLRFYRADNHTASKDRRPLEWFEALIEDA